MREVPEIYEYMKGKTNTKVIAFAMETSDDVWSNYRLKMPGWHHVLGLGKWENPTANIRNTISRYGAQLYARSDWIRCGVDSGRRAGTL